MVATRTSNSAAIRARVGHPIIDSDGHTLELTPVFLDYVKEIGGGEMVARYEAALNEQSGWMSQSNPLARGGFFDLTESERRDTWKTRPPWWSTPAPSLDCLRLNCPHSAPGDLRWPLSGGLH